MAKVGAGVGFGLEISAVSVLLGRFRCPDGRIVRLFGKPLVGADAAIAVPASGSDGAASDQRVASDIFGSVVVNNFHHWCAAAWLELDCCWFVFRASLKERRGRWGSRRLGGGELGHGLGALGHGVLGELAGEDQAHRGLDLAGRHRRFFL